MRQWFHSATLFIARSAVIARPAPQHAAQLETAEKLSWAQLLSLLWRIALFLLWDVAAPVGIFLIAYTPRWALAQS
ncbi:MAG TPA: hypothetical protein VKQ36_01160, partial [Ktedonobacterales bacterium]|nr:hypothetical protein [Ktedonobacterales bacterium]